MDYRAKIMFNDTEITGNLELSTTAYFFRKWFPFDGNVTDVTVTLHEKNILSETPIWELNLRPEASKTGKKILTATRHTKQRKVWANIVEGYKTASGRTYGITCALAPMEEKREVQGCFDFVVENFAELN